jgi:hypothetical protein
MVVMMALQTMEVPGKVEMAPAVSVASETGMALPGSVGQRAAAASMLSAATPSSAFALSGFCSHFPLCPFPTYINCLKPWNNAAVLACDSHLKNISSKDSKYNYQINMFSRFSLNRTRMARIIRIYTDQCPSALCA